MTNNADIDISHPDKRIFPADKLTKQHVVDYYRKIAPTILPHLKDRPLTLRSFPDGIEQDGFFQKRAPDHFPDYIKRLDVPLRSEAGESIEMAIADKEKDLVYLANQNVVELHLALSTGKALDSPDQMIFDLDPSDDDFEKVRELAFELGSLLEGYKLPCFVKTTGSRGVHVHVPLRRDAGFERVKPIARQLAEELLDNCPTIATLEHRKQKRGDRVFIDYLRNDYGMTAIAPYSLRALKGAPVATPISWDELGSRDTGPQSWGMKNIFRRLGAKDEPWAGFNRRRASLARFEP